MERGDHEWWLEVLTKRLHARRCGQESVWGKQRLGIDLLWDYYTGEARPPRGSEKAREVWQAMQRLSRTNYSLPVVEAVVDRCRTVAFTTAAADDENGDQEAWTWWTTNGMDAREQQIYRLAAIMRDAYAMVSDPATGPHGQPVVSVEDPRECITSHDPLTGQIRAALKLTTDAEMQREVAHVFIAGYREKRCEVRRFTRPWSSVRGNLGLGGSWALDGTYGGDGYGADPGAVLLPFDRVNIVRWTNFPPDGARTGTAEHETVIDIIDRINSQRLLRLVVAINQAFRQRALTKGVDADPLDTGADDFDPDDPDALPADLSADDVFEASPEALWDLPPGWQVWESSITELSGLLSADKADLADLAAVSRTPMDYLVPDGANQSAEGATLKRENLLAKVRSRLADHGRSNAELAQLAFLWKGDTTRADLTQLRTIWQPPEHYSLSERYAAAVQAKAAGVPWRTTMQEVLQFAPPDIRRMESERDADLLYADSVAASASPGQQQPPPPPGGGRPTPPAPTVPGQGSPGGR